MAGAAALLVSAATALANDVDEIFRLQDTDGDGAISVEEARAAAPALFRRIDGNGNGAVNVDEVAAHIVSESGPDVVMPAEVLVLIAQKTLDTWDGNGDGRVTEQEYVEASVAFLLLADSDGDRRVTREELLRFRHEAPAS